MVAEKTTIGPRIYIKIFAIDSLFTSNNFVEKYPKMILIYKGNIFNNKIKKTDINFPFDYIVKQYSKILDC